MYKTVETCPSESFVKRNVLEIFCAAIVSNEFIHTKLHTKNHLHLQTHTTNEKYFQQVSFMYYN